MPATDRALIDAAAIDEFDVQDFAIDPSLLAAFDESDRLQGVVREQLRRVS